MTIEELRTKIEALRDEDKWREKEQRDKVRAWLDDSSDASRDAINDAVDYSTAVFTYETVLDLLPPKEEPCPTCGGVKG